MTAARNVSIHPHQPVHDTIAGYFREPSDAERAISELSNAGFSKTDIGVALRDRGRISDKSAASAGSWTERLRSLFTPAERQEYSSQNALDVLDHMGVPEEEGKYFKNALRQGGVLVTVRAGSRVLEALSILKSCNAITRDNVNVEEVFEANAPESIEAGEQHIHLMGETLRVNKQRVQTGSVTLKKETVTEKQNVEVPVTREELVIERKPAEGREASPADFDSGKEIRVPLTEERVQVEKRPVVREDVSVSKRQVRDTKEVGDEVRHEELKVEKEGDVPADSTKVRKSA